MLWSFDFLCFFLFCLLWLGCCSQIFFSVLILNCAIQWAITNSQLFTSWFFIRIRLHTHQITPSRKWCLHSFSRRRTTDRKRTRGKKAIIHWSCQSFDVKRKKIVFFPSPFGIFFCSTVFIFISNPSNNFSSFDDAFNFFGLKNVTLIYSVWEFASANMFVCLWLLMLDRQ